MAASESVEASIRSLSFSVQSNKVSGEEAVARTDAFLEAFRDTLAAMPPATFESNVLSVVAALNESEKNVISMSFGLWNAVEAGHRFWNFVPAVTEHLARTTKESALAWYDAHVLPGGAARRVAVSLVEPAKALPSGAEAAAADAAAAPADAAGGAGGEKEAEVPTVPRSRHAGRVAWGVGARLLQHVEERRVLAAGMAGPTAVDAAKLATVVPPAAAAAGVVRVRCDVGHASSLRLALPTWASPVNVLLA
jgi:hypothetical protein